MKRFHLRFPLFWQMLLILWVAVIVAVMAGYLVNHQFSEMVAGREFLGWSPDVFDLGPNNPFYPVIMLAPGLVIMVLVSWWWAHRVVEPLRQLEATAYAMAEGETPSQTANTLAGRLDEVGALGRAFESMAGQAGKNRDHQRALLRDLCQDLLVPLSRQRKAIEAAGDSFDHSESLAVVLRQNERMETMTDQVLTLYRLAEKGADIAREPVSPVKVTHQVLQDATEHAEQRGVDCRLNVSPSCRGMTVLGDAGLLYRALDNVLQNALDRTPPGQSVILSVSESRVDQVNREKKYQGNHRHPTRYIRCDVEDGGPEVTSQTLANLFEPFGDQPFNRGRELGLATAANIMRSHDGDILAARGDRGLIVSLIWPVFTESSPG